MAKPAARTAYGPMSVVAIEQYYPGGQRLVQDELAFQFLPPIFKGFANLTRWPRIRAIIFNLSNRRSPGVWGGMLCRKRYIDDRLQEATDGGIQTVVILGAGLDTRAYRFASSGGLRFFEVDLPENSAYKKAKLEALYGGIPAQVSLVSLDFESQDLGSALASQGYRAEQRSFFIWEAVTQYLSEAGVRRVMDFLAQVQAGSRLVFTYIRQDFINGTARYGLDALYAASRLKRQLWQFGMEPQGVPAFLGQYNWKELEQVGGQEYTLRYLKPTGRAMPVMEIERAVYAEKL